MVEGCVNRANITGQDGALESSGQLVGGIVGIAESGKVGNCKNYGNVVARNDSNSRGRGRFAGGIIGVANITSQSFEVSNCCNYGTVTSYYQTIGGILGCCGAYTEETTIIITKCENKAKVEAVRPDVNTTLSIGLVGGILGQVNLGTITISDCTNTAVVKGD